ncbi:MULTISPECIES: nitroreductase family protein [unclassified Fibrobacter]|uniref:nitroreductase family protein n=1 Tax=unclassified Fibrobacter TaxID=2634177 RepID=UPI000D6A9ABE|nr:MULTISPECIES: nitroreductase family protein [unclassified Fibrobacter]
MRFYSQLYHESVSYAPKRVADPIVLHWEKQTPGDRRYKGKSRIDLHPGEIPPWIYGSGDGLRPVGVYVVLRGRNIPDGIYAYDREGRSGAPDVVGQLVRIGGKTEMESLLEAFPDRDFVKSTPVLYVFTGILERSVWRYGESAYSQVQKDVGSCIASIMLNEKARGSKVFPLSGFVDDHLAVTLGLSSTEVPLACMAVFPEYSEIAFDSMDDGVGESAYSNRAEMDLTLGVAADENAVYDAACRYPSRFMRQNRGECINDLSKCIRVRRLATQALPGDEFPLTPVKFTNERYFDGIVHSDGAVAVTQRAKPFSRKGMDLDDFSSMLRWLELGNINLFGAGLLKIWVVIFDVMFVYPGVYRYIPVRKSIYMQSGQVVSRKFWKCHGVPSQVENCAFAVVMTADLEEACNLLGERAYRLLNMNAGYIAESLRLSGLVLHKITRSEHFFYQDEIRNLCGIPEKESVLAEVLVGK